MFVWWNLGGGNSNGRPAMVTSGIIGGLAGLMWGIQSSSGRLMGFFENTEEVKRMR